MPESDKINKSEWENPDNWTSPGFYFSKRDTRWIVPKRNPVLGWTFNLGNKKGAWAMLITFLIPTVIMTAIVVWIAMKVGH